MLTAMTPTDSLGRLQAGAMDTDPNQLPDGGVKLPGFRGAWFLARQPWMLWPALLGTVAWAAWILVLTAQKSPGLESLVMVLALSPVIGFGFAALTGLQGFML